MKLLATIKPEDVDGNSPAFDYTTFKPRTAVRAIVFDDTKVALIRVGKQGYYMLPGGGVENEEIITGLRREILEELGCEIEITGELGSVVTYMDRWSKKQTDYGYVAKKIGDAAGIARTAFESSEGHEIVWAAKLAEATRLVETATPQSRDGKLVRTRDLLLLRAVMP